MVPAMTGYEFFDAMPESIKPGMADAFYLRQKHQYPANNPDMPAGLMDEHERCDWKKSRLHSRVMQANKQINGVSIFLGSSKRIYVY